MRSKPSMDVPSVALFDIHSVALEDGHFVGPSSLIDSVRDVN
jgi:hypothetical protein